MHKLTVVRFGSGRSQSFLILLAWFLGKVTTPSVFMTGNWFSQLNQASLISLFVFCFSQCWMTIGMVTQSTGLLLLLTSTRNYQSSPLHIKLKILSSTFAVPDFSPTSLMRNTVRCTKTFMQTVMLSVPHGKWTWNLTEVRLVLIQIFRSNWVQFEGAVVIKVHAILMHVMVWVNPM